MLFQYAETITPLPKYLAQEVAENFTDSAFHIKLIVLSVAHPELNPIEHIWGIVKWVVATRNHYFNLAKVEELTREQVKSFTGPFESGPNRRFS